MSPASRLRRTGAGLLLALGLVLPGAAPVAASPAPPSGGPVAVDAGPRTAVRPVVDANVPDPDVLEVDGTYHAYTTNSDGTNVQHLTSRDLRRWTRQPDALPELGPWVGACSFAPGGATDNCVWAPEVAAVDGGYALYYTARDTAAPFQCIGVALAETPYGPFEPVGDDPLVCPDGARGTQDLGGAIDAGTYVEDGRRYLLWKADGNCCAGKTAIIYLQELSGDGTALVGPPVELIRRDTPFEGNVVEAPTLVRRDGTYYLFYSANDFGGGGYRTAYATAPSLTGPWTKADTELMTTDRFGGAVRGPGGQDVVVHDDGSTSIVYHGWDPTYAYRAMYVSDLEWRDGVPHVAGTSYRYQAEDGVVTAARALEDGTASGGGKVGGMDFPDSSVSVRVRADRAGWATLSVRFSNGSLDATGQRVSATDLVTVDGRPAGTLVLPHTTWGNWQLADLRVRLRAGWNTVTLTRGTYFAEVDAVDVSARTPVPAPPAPPAGTPVRYEAEDGVVVGGAVGPNAGASGGEKVGGLDFADSSVTLQVTADRAGPAVLGIRFANGSERGGWPIEATDRVLVDGKGYGTVVFPHTRWDNWQTVLHQVRLRKGVNTVTIARGTWYTELDAVDVWTGTRL
ncbi:family 43 glycosylhydrolase [Vallicoccus soli]|uniref:family 43 glycosylhydrolase n=1 Tax=Vallicoccus soli TaxID=2339232 RepID=UPI001402BE2C|nr:family 43 glycosylhydrolase [Vallicoccus soli]